MSAKVKGKRISTAASCLGLLTLALILAPANALSQNRGASPESLGPVDQQQAERLRRSLALGRSPQGLLTLLEFWRNWDWSNASLSTEGLQQLHQSPSLPEHRKAFIAALLARAELRNGNLQQSLQWHQALRFVEQWRVLGPFSNEGKQGFTEVFPPEAQPLEAWDPDWTTAGSSRPIRWRPYAPKNVKLGRVDFAAVFRPERDVCAYAETFVVSDQAQQLSLWASFGGAAKAWWNGQEVFSDEHYRSATLDQPAFDRHAISVEAGAGANRLLVKVCTETGDWGFMLRVADAAGAPARNITVDASQYHAVARSRISSRRRRAQPTDFERLEQQSQTGRNQALEDWARVVSWTGAGDPALSTAADAARRAALQDPTLSRLILASQLSRERADRVRFARSAIQLDGSDPEAMLNLASVTLRGIRPSNALSRLNVLADSTAGPAAVKAAVLRSQLMADLGLPEAARRSLLPPATPSTPSLAVLFARLRTAEATGRMTEAEALRQAILAQRYDHIPTRKAVIREATLRNDLASARAQLEVLRKLAIHPRTHEFIASTYLAIGDHRAALDVAEQAIASCPEEAFLHELAGRIQLAQEQHEAARQSLARALELRPQSVAIRSLLEQLEPSRQRLDEEFASPVEAILARRELDPAFPVTVLHNLTVNTVFESGLGSTFQQYAAEANTEEGTQRLKTYSVRFDPDTQRVQIAAARVHRPDGTVLEATETFERSLGEPWYRIYYDTRALVVVFPDLEVGDVIELRYRIDDIGERNLFANYFGDLQFTAGTFPVRHYEYILITPASREFHFNDFAEAGLTHRQEHRGSTRIDRFTRTDRPALRAEPRMPGLTEVAPYLHVSTYRTWEQVGRWWWGLIQDQLQINDSLRQTVRELVEDAPDLETKVARIQNWVVRNTRYVGLEFGIHGYKPYRVPLIVQRGFGDCKDKASLLYVMLEEAGIDARIALVRTRRNGRVQDLPASLAVFDHAIAYVPALDRFIDGTAEFSGSTELPFGDQGVTVLVVGPDSAELRTTPVLPAETNVKEKSSTVELSEDGTAMVTVEETIQGTEASRYREMLASEGRQEDRLERYLRRFDPGTVLVEPPEVSVSDLEQPVSLRYQARVPSYGLWNGGALQLLPTSVNNLVSSFAPSASRRHPLELGAPFRYKETRSIRIPEGFEVAGLAAPGRLQSEFGSASLRTVQTENRIEVELNFELTRDRIARQDYPEFRRFVTSVDELLRQRINLVRADP